MNNVKTEDVLQAEFHKVGWSRAGPVILGCAKSMDLIHSTPSPRISIPEGEIANLVVWPNGPSAMSLSELAQCSTVEMTLVGVRVVFER